MHGNLAEKARPKPGELPLPARVPPIRVAWPYAIGVVVYHLVALLAFVPWYFSWTGVVLALFGLYVFGTLGINLCYHRLLTHRGLVTPKWLEHGLAILGVCCFQDTPARWVAVHRRHHQYADAQPDPHSPLVDAAGNLIGLNNAIVSRSGGSVGVGFAVPVSTARLVMEQIIETGGVTRGFIGVEAQELTPEMVESFKLPSANGVLIAGLVPKGPADEAGVKIRDILLAIEGKPVSDRQTMLDLAAELKPGTHATLRLRRGDRDLDVRIVVGTRPKQVRRR